MMLATMGPASAADPRELKAREEFAAQRYQDALELFAQLYAETLHPIYLRNIGRCYQNLGEPDQAITSFREYLRKAKTMPAEERKEIEGYIKEMEELKRRRRRARPAPPSSRRRPPTPGAPLPSRRRRRPRRRSSGRGARRCSCRRPPAPVEESPPIYSRWWFWAIVGGVVAAGVGIAFAAGAFTRTEDASCPKGGLHMP